MAAGPSTRSAGDEQAGRLRGRRREVGQREARRVGGGRGLGVRSAHPPGAARGLVTWGAPRWPPKPPNVRSAPAQPGRSSKPPNVRSAPAQPGRSSKPPNVRSAPAQPGRSSKPPTFGAPRHSRAAPLSSFGAPKWPPNPHPSERPGEAVSLLYPPPNARRPGGPVTRLVFRRDYNAGAVAAPVSAADFYERRRVPVLDSFLAYVEVGVGAPIVFLHGNPTSSYLWRNIIPPLQGVGRCLAPDLIGMGRSRKAPGGRYRFADHACYLDAWFEALALRDVTLVVHDWGSALGFDWARRHPERGRALVYMEAIVRPVTWPDWPETARKMFQAMRSPAGEELVLQKNVFVERILPASVLRGLSNEEMDKYREAFRQAGESRRPTLTWPREIPIDGEPADVAAIVTAYAEWLSASPPPKLFVNAEPGSILVGAQREFCRRWPHRQEVTVRGSHFVQEDSPAEIGRAIVAFLRRLPR